MEKLDRRKKYTRMVLKESLMELLQEKQISAITVKEICRLADINRSTFYAHFLDQFDLLEQIEAELIEDMRTYMLSYNVETEDDSLAMTEKLIEYFASKQEECRTLLNENSNSSFEKKVQHVARHYIMKNRTDTGPLDEDISEYVSAFIISGSIQVMKVWLDGETVQPPKEIARIITNMINHGLSGPK